MTDRLKCRWCEAGHSNDAGGSYDRQRCEAIWLRERIAELEAYQPNPDGETQRRLHVYRRRLERAEFVGD